MAGVWEAEDGGTPPVWRSRICVKCTGLISHGSDLGVESRQLDVPLQPYFDVHFQWA
jgi:hypothetical protein